MQLPNLVPRLEGPQDVSSAPFAGNRSGDAGVGRGELPWLTTGCWCSASAGGF